MAKRLRSFRPVEVVRGGKTTILTPRASGSGLFAPEQYLRRRTRGGDGTVVGTAPGIDAALALGLKRVMGQIDKGLEELPPERVEAMARALRQGDNERVEAEVLRKIPERRLLEEAVRAEIKSQFEHKPGLARELGRQSDFIKNAADRVLLDYVQKPGSPVASMLSEGGMTPRREGGDKSAIRFSKGTTRATGKSAQALAAARDVEIDRLEKLKQVALLDPTAKRVRIEPGRTSRIPLVGAGGTGGAGIRAEKARLEALKKSLAARLSSQPSAEEIRESVRARVLREGNAFMRDMAERGYKDVTRTKAFKEFVDGRTEDLRREYESITRAMQAEVTALAKRIDELEPAAQELERGSYTAMLERAKAKAAELGVPFRAGMSIADLDMSIRALKRAQLREVERKDTRKGAGEDATRKILEYVVPEVRPSASSAVDPTIGVELAYRAQRAYERDLRFRVRKAAEQVERLAQEHAEELRRQKPDVEKLAKIEATVARLTKVIDDYADEPVVPVRAVVVGRNPDGSEIVKEFVQSTHSDATRGRLAVAIKFNDAADTEVYLRALGNLPFRRSSGFVPEGPEEQAAAKQTRERLRAAVEKTLIEAREFPNDTVIDRITGRIFSTLPREEVLGLAPGNVMAEGLKVVREKLPSMAGKIESTVVGAAAKSMGFRRRRVVENGVTKEVVEEVFDLPAAQTAFKQMYGSKPSIFVDAPFTSSKAKLRRLNPKYFDAQGKHILVGNVPAIMEKGLPDDVSPSMTLFAYDTMRWEKENRGTLLKQEAAIEEVAPRGVLRKPGMEPGYASVAEVEGVRIRRDRDIRRNFYRILKTSAEKSALREARARARQDLYAKGWEKPTRGKAGAEARAALEERIDALTPYYLHEIFQDESRPPTIEEQARRVLLARGLTDGTFRVPTLGETLPPVTLPGAAKVFRVPVSDSTLKEMATKEAVESIQRRVDAALKGRPKAYYDEYASHMFDQLWRRFGEERVAENLTHLRRLRQHNEERLRLRKGGGGFRSAAERDAELTKAITEAAAAGPAKKPDLVAAATSPRMVERMRAQYDLLKKKDKLNAGEKLTLAQLEVNLKRVGALDGLGFLGTDGFAMVGNAVAYGIGGLAVYALYRAVVKRS